MNAPALIWIGFGITTGIAHATWLWRAARQWRTAPHAGPARLLLVVALLVAAALAGHVLAAASGWLSGFAVTGAGLARRRTP
jgi:hypothetical protein